MGPKTNVMTKSKACTDAKQDAKDAGLENVRYSTVQMRLEGKKGVLYNEARPMVPHFQRLAKVRGMGSHIVSIIANWMINDTPSFSIEKGDIFLFYTRVWSSIDFFFTGNNMLKAPFRPQVEAFFARNPVSPDCREKLQRPCPVMVRQQDCHALAIAAVEYLQSFETRLLRYCRASIVSIQLRIGGKVHSDDAKMAQLVCDAILAANTKTGQKDTTAENKCMKRLCDLLKKTFTDDDRYGTEIQSLVATERQALGPLLTTYTTLNGETTAESSQILLHAALKSKKMAHHLLPHMVRISNASLTIARTHNLVSYLPRESESDASNEDDDVTVHCDADDEDEDEDDVVDTTLGWKKERRPKMFTALPVFKLRVAMGYYGPTEMQTLYSSLMTSSKKRKRDDDAGTDEAVVLQCDETHFGKELFNFARIKGKKSVGIDVENVKWRLSHFQTNGVVVSLTFISGSVDTVEALHVSKLVKAGYQIPVPSEKITRNSQRGLYRTSAQRNDFDISYVAEANDSFATVDFGFVRPVEVGVVNAEAIDGDRSAIDIVQNGKPTFWHLTKQEWMDQSGRSRQQYVEEKRRRVNTAYQDSLDRLSETRRRCSDVALFDEYANMAMSTMDARSEELMADLRVLFRWKCTKTLESFLCRVADRMADRSTLRYKRVVERQSIADDEREALRLKLIQKRRLAREVDARRTVFVGDGTFKCTMRGNPSMPKKKLLKRLAVRTVTVLIDEFRTSKQCPCGGGELRDGSTTNDGKRVRVHKTDGVSICDRSRRFAPAFATFCCTWTTGMSWLR